MIRSLLTLDNRHASTEDIKAWLRGRNERVDVRIAPIPFSAMNGWRMAPDRRCVAPAGLVPHATIKFGNDPSETIALDANDAFRKSIEHFYICTKDEAVRKANYAQLLRQASLIDQFYRISGL